MCFTHNHTHNHTPVHEVIPFSCQSGTPPKGMFGPAPHPMVPIAAQRADMPSQAFSSQQQQQQAYAAAALYGSNPPTNANYHLQGQQSSVVGGAGMQPPFQQQQQQQQTPGYGPSAVGGGMQPIGNPGYNPAAYPAGDPNTTAYSAMQNNYSNQGGVNYMQQEPIVSGSREASVCVGPAPTYHTH